MFLDKLHIRSFKKK